MHWLTPRIETNAAYGMCMFLFVLLLLLVRKRKLTERTSFMFHASPLLANARPALKHPSERGLRRVTAPKQHSGLLPSAGLEYTPRVRANAKVPEIAANRLSAPMDFQALPISDEVKMNSPSFPFEHLDPVAMAGISGFAAPAT